MLAEQEFTIWDTFSGRELIKTKADVYGMTFESLLCMTILMVTPNSSLYL